MEDLWQLCPTPNIANDDAQNPAVHEEEAERGEPETRQEGALSQELELVPLLEPHALGRNPEGQGRDAQRLVPQEGRLGKVEREEDHVPEKVLL